MEDYSLEKHLNEVLALSVKIKNDSEDLLRSVDAINDFIKFK